MKKRLKKFISFVLVFAMVFSLGMPSFAAELPEEPKEEETVEAPEEPKEEETAEAPEEPKEEEIEELPEETEVEAETEESTKIPAKLAAESNAAVTVTINGTTKGYENITEAWAAAQNQTATIHLSQSQEVTETLTIGIQNDNTDITITMDDGVTLSGALEEHLINIMAGSLTIKSGSLINTSGIGIMMLRAKEVIISGGKVSGATYGIYAFQGDLEISGGEVIGTKKAGVLVISESTFAFSDGKISSEKAGLEIRGGATTITGGEIVGSSDMLGEGILISGDGPLTISGGKIRGVYGLRSSEGNAAINISGGEITGEFVDGIYIGGAGSVNISGGTFSTAEGAVGETISVGNGTIKDLLDTTQGNTHFAYYNGTAVNKNNLITDLSGTGLSGTVTVGVCTHSYSEYTDNGNGTHTPACAVCGNTIEPETHEYENGVCVCGAKDALTNVAATVTVGGTTTNYESFAEAWAAAQNNTAAVHVLKSQTVTEKLTVNSKTTDITLTMADGVTLSGSLYNGIIEVSSGSLTLENGSLKNTGGTVIMQKGGNVTISGGTVTGSGLNACVRIQSGSFTVSGGKISSSTSAPALLLEKGSVTEITGGEISGAPKDYNGTGISVSGDGSSLTISGGTIEGGNGLLVSSGKVNANISGGTFKSTYVNASTTDAYAISVKNGTTVKQLLDTTKANKHFAFYQRQVSKENLITDVSVTELSGTVTVGECLHDYSSYRNNRNETHTVCCAICDNSLTTEAHEYKDGVCVCGAEIVASVMISGQEPQYFNDIGNAFLVAEGHTATITLLESQEMEVPEWIADENSNITLRMKEGVTLSGNRDGYGIIYVGDGHLTIESGVIKNNSNTGFGVLAAYGNVSITGGEIIGGAVGLMVVNDGNVEITGGTFSGGEAAISSQKVAVKTFLDQTQEGKHVAYYSVADDGTETLITEGLNEKTLTGKIKVTDCTHSYGDTWTDNGDGTHSHVCAVCGEKDQKALHQYKDGVCVCGVEATASVAISGRETRYFADIVDAFRLAEGNTAEIHMLKSQEISGRILIGTSEKTNITLTMEKDASLHSNSVVGELISISRGSTLTIENGTIRNTSPEGIAVTVGDGTINMNGGEIIGAACGLYVTYSGNAKITGGTISGGQDAIESQNAAVKTFLDWIQEGTHAAYYSVADDGTETLITEGLNEKTLTGKIRVAECRHSFDDWTDTGSGIHIHGCVVCGLLETAEHTFGEWADVEEVPGTRKHTCEDCGFTETQAKDGWYKLSDYRTETGNTAPTKDGYIFAGWYTSDTEFTMDTALKQGAEEPEYAYAKFVDAKVLTVKFQITNGTSATDEKTALRLVTTVDSLLYSSIGFNVSYNDKSYDMTTNKVYKKLTGTDGVGAFTYEPTVFSEDSLYFAAFNTDVMNNLFSTPITVTARWVTLDGTVVEGTPREIIIENSASFQK